MRIREIQATPVSIPARRPCGWAWGCTLGLTRTIVEIISDDGSVGLGECVGSAAAHLLQGALGGKLLGHDIGDFAGLRRLFRMDFSDYLSLATPDLVEAYAAVDMALWDLAGKQSGKPVYELLGGAVRPQAEFVAYGYLFDLDASGMRESDLPAAMAALARDSLQRSGADMFEFKVGRYSLETDIENVRAIRAAVGPQVLLAVDANMKWDLASARRFLSAVRPERLCGFEEPVPSFVDMSTLCVEYGMLMSSHSLDPEKRVHYPHVQGVVGDLHLQGGLSDTPRQAAQLARLGLTFWQRACLETGISWAAMVHLGIACPHIQRASQALMDYVEDDLVLGEPWPVHKGGVVPPATPGLGVTLDRSALGQYHEHFQQHGEYTHFDRP